MKKWEKYSRTRSPRCCYYHVIIFVTPSAFHPVTDEVRCESVDKEEIFLIDFLSFGFAAGCLMRNHFSCVTLLAAVVEQLFQLRERFGKKF
jgi:hypothetical protein